MEAKERSSVEKIYKWAVEDIFATDEDWEREYSEIQERIKDIETFKGKLSDKETFKKAMKTNLSIMQRLDRLYIYSSMKNDEDTRVAKYQAMNNKAQELFAAAAALASFIEPEIISLGKEKFDDFIKTDSEIKFYEHYLDNIFRKQKHILSDKEENILSALSPALNAVDEVYGIFSDADLTFPNVKNSKGEERELTGTNFTLLLESDDRTLRKNAYEVYYERLGSFGRTAAGMLQGCVSRHIALSKLRGYPSARAAALDYNSVPESVYDRLVEAVHNKISSLHSYVSLRKKSLKIEDLKMYDIYTPIVEDVDKKYSIDEAKEIILGALKPMGEEYCNIVNSAFKERWIDYYENPGKRGGAYSGGSYDTKPYILLNYHGNLDNVFTMIHELGHSIHSYFSRKNNDFLYGSYPIFLAEIASTTNEMLLNEYLIRHESDPEVKKYLLNHLMDSFKGTLYRQTMFAEFEQSIHAQYQEGKPLTSDGLREEYRKLNHFYYGEDIESDELIGMEWARIPHFYYDFYVFQYATGISAASAFYKRILDGGAEMANIYINNFLKSGDTKYPIETLKTAGLDMNDPKVVEDALSIFQNAIDEFGKMK